MGSIQEDANVTAIKENFGSLVLCLMELLIGILLLISPVGFTAGIIITFGFIVMIRGFIAIIRYFKSAPLSAEKEQNLAKGLIGVVFGGFCILQTQWLIAAFPVLTVLYGIAILVTGFYKIQFVADMLRQGKPQWGWAAASAVLSVLFAIMILMNPFSTTITLWTFTAITLIAEAIVDVIYLVMKIRKTKKAKVYIN